MVQTFQLGDRVTYRVPHRLVAKLSKELRTGSGLVVKVWMKFPASPKLTRVVYVIQFDKTLLSSREWGIEAAPGKRPRGLSNE